MNKTQEWNEARKKLKIEFEEKGITECEIGLPGCWRDNALSFAHKEKRIFYYNKPGLLGDFNQVLLACIPCHQKLEDDKELTNEYFNNLRV